MEIIKAENLPRKWEWIAEQLKKTDGTEKMIEVSKQIDEHMKTIYGEHTHTAQWILDMRVWQRSAQLQTIVDMATRDTNCTACEYVRIDRKKDCKKCEFAKIGGECGIDGSLFSRFVAELMNYKFGDRT